MRSKSRRRRRTNGAKPRRRRTTTANPRRRRVIHASAPIRRRRHRNPATHRRRRRNPSHSGGLFQKGLALAAGGALVQFTLGFIPPIGGVSPLADAARTAGTGWLLGTAMSRTGIMKDYANDVTLAGFTLAGGKLITSFILPFANRMFTPRPTPPPSNGQVQQMAGLAMVYPGLQPYGAYGRGMNGLAVIDPAIQPFGEYASN